MSLSESQSEFGSKQELHAAGFNAHGQLNFDESTRLQSAAVPPEVDGGGFASATIRQTRVLGTNSHIDQRLFKLVVEGIDIKVVDASWSQTMLRLNNHEMFVLGHPLRVSRRTAGVGHDPEIPISTHDGLQAWCDRNGNLVTPRGEHISAYYRLRGKEGRFTHIACTDARLTAAAFVPREMPRPGLAIVGDSVTILMFPSLERLLDSLYDDAVSQEASRQSRPAGSWRQWQPGHSESHSIPVCRTPDCSWHTKAFVTPQALLSTRTGFVALTKNDEVYTWGDARFSHALGREVSEDQPSDEPGLVQDLAGLDIGKIVTGGNLMAALTKGGDAFVWGMPELGGGNAGSIETRDHGRLNDVLADRGEGEYVARVRLPILMNDGSSLIEDGCDLYDEIPEISDIALGDGHILVVDVQHHVWACGSNEYGQLGLGEDRNEKAKWHLVETFERLRIQQGKKAVKVYAGDLTSFVVVQEV